MSLQLRRKLLRRANPSGYVSAVQLGNGKCVDELLRGGYIKPFRGFVYELTSRGLRDC